MGIEIPGGPVIVGLFALFALLSVLGAIRVVASSDPFVSALSLLFNFVSLGAIYLLLGQDFVAVAQILVYAGAVVVLFLFVIAYLGGGREIASDARRARLGRPAALITAVALLALVGGVAVATRMPGVVDSLPATEAGHRFGSAQAIGEVFLTRYSLAFEVTSLVLLVAAVGGIILGLTGRARHDRLQRIMAVRSADQQRRWYAEHAGTKRSRAASGSAVAAGRPRPAPGMGSDVQEDRS